MNVFGYEINKVKPKEPISKVVAGKNRSLYAHTGKSEPLSMVQLRAIYLNEPLVYKAINKKNRDTFQNGFIIKRRDGTEPFKNDIDIINEFIQRTRLMPKLEIGGKCKDIYGDGYVEKIYLEPKSRTADMPPPANAEPIGLKVLDAESLTKKETKMGRGDTVFYVFRGTDGEIYIHPDRIIHIVDPLPHADFGNSKLSILRHILKSKINTDISVGEILDWSSHGILDMTVNNCTPEQEKHMAELFRDANHFYVHDETYVLDVKNPTMGEPKSYFEYMYVNIAACFMMPTHILTGVQPGHVIGSEIGVADYHKDLANDQTMIYTPIIEDLFEELLKSRGKKWVYEVVWRPTFIDELSEGRIMEKRALAAKEGYVNRIIGQKEARKIMKDGVIDINPEDLPDDIKEEAPEGGPSIPNISPTGVKKDNQKRTSWRPLTDREKKLILAKAAEERLLGEMILKEQASL